MRRLLLFCPEKKKISLVIVFFFSFDKNFTSYSWLIIKGLTTLLSHQQILQSLHDGLNLID